MKNIILALAFSLISTVSFADTQDVYKNVKDSIVTIHNSAIAEAPLSPIDELFTQSVNKHHFKHPFSISKPKKEEGLLGAGSIISVDGLVVTNAHVINNHKKLTVELSDGTILPAIEVGSDPKADIAVIKIQCHCVFNPMKFGNSDDVNVGENVIAIGSPLGFTETVSRGILSAKNRFLDTQVLPFLQTDATINPGNSGGPLLNENGEIIGMNSEIYSPTKSSIGLGFALPSNIVKKITDSLIKNGTYSHAVMGVEIRNFDEDTSTLLGLPDMKGVLVQNVIDGGAAKGHIKKGDILVGLNGKSINSLQEFLEKMYMTKPNKKIELEVIRDNGDFMVISFMSGAS